jgi:hypothetical protein
MKKKILIIATTSLLYTLNAFAIDFAAINKAQEARMKVEQAQKEEADRLKAMADQERFVRENAGNNKIGFTNTVKTINAVRTDIKNSYNYTSTLKFLNCAGGGGYQSIQCIQSASAYGQSLGGQINYTAGSAKIPVGNQIFDIKSKELYSVVISGDDGIITTIVFNNNISTVNVSDNRSFFTLKINMNEPQKSQIIDANLPLNAMNTLNQVYNKKGLTLSENQLFTLIEDWYRADKDLLGVGLNQVAGALITDRNVRTRFLDYCTSHAQ